MRSHSHANNPSSSSLRLGAGRGAPGFSWVGSLTYPPSPNGFSDLNLDSIGVEEEEEVVVVLAGTSGSLRDHPKEFIESRKEFDAMFAEVSSHDDEMFLASTERSSTEVEVPPPPHLIMSYLGRLPG